jgi:hypothetical protein
VSIEGSYRGPGQASYKGTGNDDKVELSSWLYNYEEDSKKYKISTQMMLVVESQKWYNAKTDADREAIESILRLIKVNTDDNWLDRFAEQIPNDLFGDGLLTEAIFQAGDFSELELLQSIDKLDEARSEFYIRLSVISTNDVTPGGRVFTTHGAYRANSRGFSPEAIDRIVDNNKPDRVVEDGEVTYEHTNARGNKVVLNDKGGIVSVHSKLPGGKYMPKSKSPNAPKFRPKK